MFHNCAGHVLQLLPNLQLVLAPNPSAMTGPGTNTYLVGNDTLAIIDPGPDDTAHRAALSAAIGTRHVSHIIVTHSHLDHSPLAKPLGAHFAAPVLAFGGSTAGRSPVMQSLAATGLAGGGEGLDSTFEPDVQVADGDFIQGNEWCLQVLHTPGQLGNHSALAWDDAIFVGDMVMDWSTSLISPPEGDMSEFLASCVMLQSRSEKVFYPGHGAPLADPYGRLAEVIAHRDARAASILVALGQGPATLEGLVTRIYTGLDPRLTGAAGRNVFAHLIALSETGHVRASPALAPDATFALC